MRKVRFFRISVAEILCPTFEGTRVPDTDRGKYSSMNGRDFGGSNLSYRYVSFCALIPISMGQILGVPAKKETMKKHDLPFARRCQADRRKRHPLGAGEHAAELG